MDDWLEKSTEEIFSALLKRISAAELKSFIEDAVANEESLRHRFIIGFIESANIPSREKFSLLIRSILQLAIANPKEFQHELSQFLNKAQQLIEAKDYLDAFYAAAAFISEFKLSAGDLRNDSNEYFSRVFALLSSISKSDAGFELKEKVYDFLLTEVKNAANDFNSSVKELWIQSVMDSASEDSQLQRALDLIVELTGKNRNQLGQAIDEKEEEQLLLTKLRLLEFLNRHSDIQHLLDSNKRIKSFRFKLIDECIKRQNWEEAKELIKEGRRHELRKGTINLSSEWDELLLKIAQKEHDIRSIRNLALQLFLSSEYDFKFYHLLKQHYDPARWNAQIDRIASSIRKEKSFSTKGIHVVAKIFIEEKEWEKLLRLVEKNAALDFVDQYAGYLKEKFPEQLLEIYRKAIRRFAEKFMGPDAYRIIADALRKMQSLPNSKEIVQSLAIELKVTYRQRRAMVEELNKIVL